MDTLLKVCIAVLVGLLVILSVKVCFAETVFCMRCCRLVDVEKDGE